jgi:SAM-dependent methyltransferase
MLHLCLRNIYVRRYDDQPSQFDIEYGVSTEGCVDLGDLNIDSPSEIWGVQYEPTPPVIFDRIMILLPPREKYSFIDLGSGKGRVLLMASREPFRSVIGVEFSSELCAIAKANLEKFKGRIAAQRVDVVCQDAGLYEFPSGPLIVYCYFAFSKEVMVQVVAHLVGRQDETIFVYYNPHYHELFTSFELLHAESTICIWRSTGSASN